MSIQELLAKFLPSRSSLKDEVEQLRAKVAEFEITAARYKTLTDHLLASVIVRTVDGTISYCSPYTEVLTGYSLTDFYNQRQDLFLEIMHRDDHDLYHRALKVIAIGEPFQYRYRFTHRSGIEMWAETRIMPLVNVHGDVTSSLSVTLDVTGSVLYQQQTEERSKDLQDFTYMVSHDLKTPAYTLKGIATILREELSSTHSEETSELLTHMDRAVLRLEQLINGIIEFSKVALHIPNLAPVSLLGIITDVVEDLSGEVQKRGATIKVDSNLPIVDGEPLPLYQIFFNLVSNALKYSHPERTPVIEIVSVPQKNPRLAVISVKDNGRGIPNDKLDLIFKPFKRLDDTVADGSGIGLTTVKKLVEKLGGQVNVVSEYGQGSLFTVSLRKVG